MKPTQETDLGYYLHNSGITDLMDPIGEYSLINELMPPQSEPCPSQLAKKVSTTRLPTPTE